MRRQLLLILLVTSFGSSIWAAQATPAGQATPPQRGTPPATPGGTQTPPPAPVQRAPAPRPASTPTVTIQTSDGSGLPLGKVEVSLHGPLTRDGVTAEDGTLKLVNLRPGNYRLRFSREGSITLERDITVRAGEPLLVDVTLNAAPAPPPAPPPPPAPEPAKPTLGAPGDPRLTAIPTFVEKNFIGGREPRKDSELGCTSTGAATLHQLREAWINRFHADSDEWLYVVAGSATLRIGSNDQPMAPGTFSLIPHTVVHSIVPTGRTPFIVVSILSGAPCTNTRPSTTR
jgi:Carboxypeptidase regulatory-like domain/Cupin domain